MVDLINKGNQVGDGLITLKKQFPKYDIVLGNILNIPVITLIGTEVRKQFIKHEIDYTYQKLPAMSNMMTRIFGKGLVFSEGEDWKRKRRIFSKFFTYEFIHSQIPTIVDICKTSF